jgi:hypothetical protein
METVPAAESRRARGWMTDSEATRMGFVPVRTALSEMVMLEEKVTGGLGPDCEMGGRIECRFVARLLVEDMVGDVGAWLAQLDMVLVLLESTEYRRQVQSSAALKLSAAEQ